MSSKAYRERLDFDRFQSLVATPATANPFTLPGRGRLGLSKTATLAAGAASVTVGRQTFQTAALAADQVHRGYTGERGMPVTVAGPAGTYKVHVIDPQGHARVIAQITI